jgi:hypothetical protein
VGRRTVDIPGEPTAWERGATKAELIERIHELEERLENYVGQPTRELRRSADLNKANRIPDGWLHKQDAGHAAHPGFENCEDATHYENPDKGSWADRMEQQWADKVNAADPDTEKPPKVWGDGVHDDTAAIQWHVDRGLPYIQRSPDRTSDDR